LKTVARSGCNPRDRRIVDAEHAAERFERAVIRMVTEFHAEHVERHTVARHGLAISGEAESRARSMKRRTDKWRDFEIDDVRIAVSRSADQRLPA
jgi:hypothetical protein